MGQQALTNQQDAINSLTQIGAAQDADSLAGRLADYDLFTRTNDADWEAISRASSILSGTAGASGSTTTNNIPWWSALLGTAATVALCYYGRLVLIPTLLGVAVAIVRELLDRRIRGAADLAEFVLPGVAHAHAEITAGDAACGVEQATERAQQRPLQQDDHHQHHPRRGCRHHGQHGHVLPGTRRGRLGLLQTDRSVAQH